MKKGGEKNLDQRPAGRHMVRPWVLTRPGPRGAAEQKVFFITTSTKCGTGGEGRRRPTVVNSYLGVEPTGSLQKQGQVGLDLAAVGVGPVLGLALKGGDLVFEGVVPPEGRGTQRVSG